MNLESLTRRYLWNNDSSVSNGIETGREKGLGKVNRYWFHRIKSLPCVKAFRKMARFRAVTGDDRFYDFLGQYLFQNSGKDLKVREKKN